MTQSQGHLPPIYESLNENVSLFDMKMAKKQAESEAIKIQNRIALLKQEQMKVQRKIDTTNIKVQEIIEQKQKQQGKKEERLKLKKEEPQPFTYPLAVQQRELVQKAYLETLQKRKMDAKQVQQKNKLDMKEVQEDRIQNILKLKNRVLEIKEQEQISNQNKNNKLKVKRNKVREEVQNESLQTFQEKAKQDQQIRQLEIEEMQVLQQLQQTQHRQKEIQEKYSLVQTLSPKKFEEQFISGNNQHSYRGTLNGSHLNSQEKLRTSIYSQVDTSRIENKQQEKPKEQVKPNNQQNSKDLPKPQEQSIKQQHGEQHQEQAKDQNQEQSKDKASVQNEGRQQTEQQKIENKNNEGNQQLEQNREE